MAIPNNLGLPLTLQIIPSLSQFEQDLIERDVECFLLVDIDVEFLFCPNCVEEHLVFGH
jgi:hypothetical protein